MTIQETSIVYSPKARKFVKLHRVYVATLPQRLYFVEGSSEIEPITRDEATILLNPEPTVAMVRLVLKNEH